MNRRKSSSVTTTGSIITPLIDPPHIVEGDDVVRVGHRQREAVVAEGDRNDAGAALTSGSGSSVEHARIDLHAREVDELDAGVLVGALEPLGQRRP